MLAGRQVHECVVERVGGQFEQLAVAVPEVLHQLHALPGHGSRTNQAVIRVHGAGKTHVVEKRERVIRNAVADAGLDVGGRADFQWNLAVTDSGGNLLALDALERSAEVLIDAHTVAETVCTLYDSVLQRIDTSVFTCVNGHWNEVFPQHGKSLSMVGRREAVFRTRDVETDNVAVGVLPVVVDNQLCDFLRVVILAHRADEQTRGDVPSLGGSVSFTLCQALDQRINNSLHIQAPFQMVFRSQTQLSVDDIVGSQIFDGLTSHTRQRLSGLHDSTGVREGSQVARQRSGVAGVNKPLLQLIRIGGRQLIGVTAVRGQVDNGLRAQTTIEVIMKQYLGQAGDNLTHFIEIRCRRLCVQRLSITVRRISHNGQTIGIAPSASTSLSGKYNSALSKGTLSPDFPHSHTRNASFRVTFYYPYFIMFTSRRFSTTVALLATSTLLLPSTAPTAMAQSPSLTDEPPVVGPAPGIRDTEGCPYKTLPPAPVDSSEVPAPGKTSPAPLPVPKKPAGGSKMSACGIVSGKGFDVPKDLSASAWTVFDLKSGDVIAAKDPHGRYRPASIIKVLLAMEALEDLKLDDRVTATFEDANMEGSRVGIVEGVNYSVETLLTGLLLNSGNDTGHALARELGGMAKATEKVNTLAKKLGATDTRVVNPTGLDAPGQMTSAYDMSLFFQHAFNNSTYRKLSATHLATIPGDKELEVDDFEIANDNQLIAQDYPGALGGKTGFTDDARHTFAGVAERDGRRLGVIVLDATVEDSPRAWEQAASLLDAGFAAPQDSSVGVLEASAAENQLAEKLPDILDGESAGTGLKITVSAAIVGVIALVAMVTYRSGKRKRG